MEKQGSCIICVGCGLGTQLSMAMYCGYLGLFSHVVALAYWIQESLGRPQGYKEPSLALPSTQLLALVRYLHRLFSVLERHAGRVFFGRNGPRLGLVLDESDTTASRHRTHLAEPFEAAKDGRKGVFVHVVG
jgi:hypothetical protein